MAARPSAEQPPLSVQQALDLGVRHHNAGDLAKAKNIYSQILQADPNQPIALQLLGVLAHQVGKNDFAIELISKAVTIKPDYDEGHFNLGIALKAAGRLEEAAASYRKALAIKPDNADAYYNLGNALEELKKFDDAATSYRMALAVRPDFAKAHGNLGYLLQKQKKLDDAVACFRQALAIKPDYAEAHSNLGLALHDLGRLDEAVASYRSALAIDPEFVEVHSNLGLALQELGQLDEAMNSYYRALAIKPDHTDAHNNLGLAHQELGQIEHAFNSYNRAIAITPDSAEVRNNLGMLQLLTGDFDAGWANYAWRWKTKDAASLPREYPQPFWDGGPLQGRTIFIYPEQGLGDIIQFVRYLPLVAAHGGRVLFEVPKPLLRLFEGSRLVENLVRENQAPPPFDCHAALLDLPKLLNTALATVPGNDRFPEASPELRQQWAERLPASRDVRLGIVWAGNPKHKNDRNRSIDGNLFQLLAEIPWVSVYSLQVGRDGEAGRLFADKVVDLAPFLGDFADTAAAMSHLDLIVSADTSVAHLAGALGKPIWTLLPSMPDWRWLLARDDSPWYPTMRLFRQKTRGDWNGVLQGVGEALMAQRTNPQNGFSPAPE